MSTNEEDIQCPFCKEGDFDLVGLKMHLQQGQCDLYNELSIPKRVTMQELEKILSEGQVENEEN